jgi:hypothetical protein
MVPIAMANIGKEKILLFARLVRETLFTGVTKASGFYSPCTEYELFFFLITEKVSTARRFSLSWSCKILNKAGWDDQL